MKKVLRWLDENFEVTLCCIFLSVMSIVILLQIICRQLGLDLSWNEEFARYTYVWLVYIGCAYTVKVRKHIKLEAMLLLLGRKGNLVMDVIANIFFLIFALMVLYEAIPYFERLAFVRRQYSPAMRMPMFIPYGAVALGFLLTAFRLVQDTFKLVREYREGGKA
ncbi:TRAP transporter small permease [Desulfovibrio sp. OttesenSCG-928-C14]|nr:TRAP transporter small permease [Desulfovibrio sp. OttesenSCG-928-C14]